MSTERFTLFEETMQTSSLWLRELADGAGEADERRAYQLLGAALQALRDRLPPEEAVQLGAQLPVVIRGLFYDDWHPEDTPKKTHTLQEFLDRVAARHDFAINQDMESAVRAAFEVINRNVSVGEVLSLIRALPAELRELWPSHAVRAAESGRSESSQAPHGADPNMDD